MANIADAIRAGSQNDASQNLSRTAMGISQILDQRTEQSKQGLRQDKQLAMQEEQLGMAKQSHGLNMELGEITKQKAYDEMSLGVYNRLSEFSRSIMDLDTQVQNKDIEIAAKSKLLTAPAAEGETVDLDTLRSEVSTLAQEKTTLLEAKRKSSNALNTHILGILDNPQMVGVLLKSNVSNAEIGKLLKEGFQTEDPVLQEKFVSKMTEIAQANTIMEQAKADRQYRTQLRTTRDEAIVKEQAKADAQIRIDTNKEGLKYAVENAEKGTKNVAANVVADVYAGLGSVLPDGLLDQDTARLAELKDSVGLMNPGDAKKDYALFSAFHKQMQSVGKDTSVDDIIKEYNSPKWKAAFTKESPVAKSLEFKLELIKRADSSSPGAAQRIWKNVFGSKQGSSKYSELNASLLTAGEPTEVAAPKAKVPAKVSISNTLTPNNDESIRKAARNFNRK